MSTQKLAGKNLIICWIFILCYSVSSCYSYRVATHALPGTEVSKTVTAHSLFWGLIQKPREIHTPICDSLGVNGMAEVSMKTNFGYALITVVTLGIWSPVKVEFKCSKPCKKSEIL